MNEHVPYDQIRFRPCDFIVKYRFYDNHEGGRKTGPPTQGYRSDFMYAEDEADDKQACKMWCIHPEFLDEDENVIRDKSLIVSQQGYAKMWLLNREFEDLHKNRIKIGQKGFFMEGSTKTAECEVTEIIGLSFPKYSEHFIDAVKFITLLCKSYNATYEIFWYSSGCIMVDVWYNNRIFIVQLEFENEKECFGLSELKESEPDFTSRADIYYKTTDQFKRAFSDLFISQLPI